MNKPLNMFHMTAFFRSFGVLFFLFCAERGLSQNFQIGIKGGLSLPNLTSGSGGTDVSRGYRSITGPDLGAIFSYQISEQFNLESGLEWSTQGGEKSGLQTIPPTPNLAPYFPPGTEYLYANFTSDLRLQYLMMPVLLKYSMPLGAKDHWKIYIDGGIFGALMLSAKASASGTSQVYLDKEQKEPISSIPVDFDSTGNVKDQLHKGNFGIEGNIGLVYQAPPVSYFFEAGGNYGLIALQKNSMNGVNHTGALLFRAGILFSLKN